VYGLVKRHPGLKKVVKFLYQGAFDMLPREKEYFSGRFDFKEGYFYGFHDVCPFSSDDSMLLANKVPFDGRMPSSNEGIQIGYFDLKDATFGEFHPIAESFAWNFHKGCRLQWVDDNRVIFNTAENGKLVSMVCNVNTGETFKCDYPIDTVKVSCDGSVLATSFNYSRLNRCMPGYGYAVGETDSDESAPADSGLFLVDILKNTRQLLVSLKELKNRFGKEYGDGNTHFVTHSEFSQDGRYIAFLYRAAPYGKEGEDMHKTWIMIYDIENKDLFPLPTQESGSHFEWNSGHCIIASCTLDGSNCHVLYDVDDPMNYKIISGNKVNSDGHQTWVTDDIFVTDTYPDRRRMARLYRVKCISGEVELLAKTYSPKEFQTRDIHCHIACDLHPRMSHSEKVICFDSPRTGKRSIYLMKTE